MHKTLSVNIQEAKIDWISFHVSSEMHVSRHNEVLKYVAHWNQPGYILIMPSETITRSVAPFRAPMPFSTDLGFSDIMWNASSKKWKWSVLVEGFNHTGKTNQELARHRWYFARLMIIQRRKTAIGLVVLPIKQNSSRTDYTLTEDHNRLFSMNGNSNELFRSK